MSTSTSDELTSDLRHVERRLLAMAARAERQLAEAMAALATLDEARARAVIARDDELDRDEVEIDELALALIAMRRPQGPDLRFLTMTFKFVTDLERIGDLSSNIATRTIELARFPPMRLHADLPRLADLARRNLRAAIDSFVMRDTDRAAEVIAADAEIDRLNAALFAELFSRIAVDHGAVNQIVPLTSVARYLERIGDHVKNLAEEVIFMVRARDVRHPSVRT